MYLCLVYHIFHDFSHKLIFMNYGYGPKNTVLCLCIAGVMGEYEPKIEVHFPDTVPAAKGSVVTLECFALGK